MASVVFPPNNPLDIKLVAQLPFVVMPADNIQLIVTTGEKILLRGKVEASQVQGVKVVLINLETQQTKTTEPDASGSYSFDVTTVRSALVVVTQETGQAWQPNTVYRVGEIVRPRRFNQRLYQVTQAGNSGEREPSWWLEVHGELGQIGSAQARVMPHFTPRVHGPIVIKEPTA
ncbi:hypothetical protein MM188_003225 [Vibrio cholerae]|nr:hypothetical protein [Vibrio cholerae]